MTMPMLVRGEIRKITTTKLPWTFLAVLIAIAGLNAAIVAFGTEAGGSKAFVATAVDQRSLMAFAFNAMMGTSLFGAIAVAREYGHDTVVPMFLTSPNRTRAVLAQLTAILLAGAALAAVGQALIVACSGAGAAADPVRPARLVRRRRAAARLCHPRRRRRRGARCRTRRCHP